MSCYAVCCLQAVIQPTFMKFCLELKLCILPFVTVIALFIDISAVFCDSFKWHNCRRSLFVIVVTEHFLSLPFHLRVRGFPWEYCNCHQLWNKVAEEEVKIQCLLKFEWDWEACFLIIFYVNNYSSCSERLTLCMDQYICYYFTEISCWLCAGCQKLATENEIESNQEQ